MIENKDFENSDSDDSDFKVDLHEDLSDDSVDSEYESEFSTKEKSYKSSPKRKAKNIINQNSHFPEEKNKNELSPIEEKARANSLWQTFLNDTATSSKSQSCNEITNLSENTVYTSSDSEKVKDNNEKPTMYSQNVNLNENVDIKKIIKNKITTNKILINKNDDKLTKTSQIIQQENPLKKRHISSILDNIKKKQKLNTLEKSKLDWKQFKEEHNLAEEISHYNRGKSGYLERQDFLQRTDSRQFEIEKELRNVGKRKTR